MSYPTPYQERYCKNFFQLRVYVYYLELYMEQSESIDRSINIFMAIASSSSICGWAIWSQFSFVWAIIIAISQFIGAIKHYLPYKTRLKAIRYILIELEELLTFSEKKWFEVAEGYLSDEDINNLLFQIRTKQKKVLQKHLINTLPQKNKLFKKANILAVTYFQNFYGGNNNV